MYTRKPHHLNFETRHKETEVRSTITNVSAGKPKFLNNYGVMCLILECSYTDL